MARIAGVNIPDNKHAVISLTYIYGVGRSQARRLCAETGVEESAKIGELTEEQLLQRDFGKDTSGKYFDKVFADPKKACRINPNKRAAVNR